MDVKIEPSWKEKLKDEFDQIYFDELISFVKNEYGTKTIFPPGPQIFRAFDETSFDSVKVVILGQDPYHTSGVAHGLSFSVDKTKRLPPSLQNIYKEIESDLGLKPENHGDLSRWAKQGVLLLNATLTVEKGKAGSHQNHGWEEFTDAVIEVINEEKEHVVFILWGKYAQNKGAVIDESKHLVIRSPHPSPFSANRGFFGSKPFSKTNEYLKKYGQKEIDWR